MEHSLQEQIDKAKEILGEDLCILAHHYQRDSIVRHAHHVGDSLELARKIPQINAKYIIMCGVFFMAETAAILAREGQRVYIPYRDAGCTLADMAPSYIVEKILEELNKQKRIIPLAYVNTSASIKALCGRFGGSVCTSANSDIMLKWALNEADGVLFLPDKNLALNTARKIGLPKKEIDFLEGTPSSRATLYIWPGLCDVHVNFRKSHIERCRKKYPNAKIIVHPECPPGVVEMADEAGSTSKIIKYVDSAPSGSTIFVGTEIHMVDRLAKKYHPPKHIYPLFECSCRFMDTITPHRLYKLLQGIKKEQQVIVKRQIKEFAQIALNKMLEICSS